MGTGGNYGDETALGKAIHVVDLDRRDSDRADWLIMDPTKVTAHRRSRRQGSSPSAIRRRNASWIKNMLPADAAIGCPAATVIRYPQPSALDRARWRALASSGTSREAEKGKSNDRRQDSGHEGPDHDGYSQRGCEAKRIEFVRRRRYSCEIARKQTVRPCAGARLSGLVRGLVTRLEGFEQLIRIEPDHCNFIAIRARSARPAPRIGPLVLCLLAGCGQEVAQTAWRAPAAVPATTCSAPAGPILANVTGVGPAAASKSILVGHGYGPGLGPGIFVNARDAFRVFLNGDLVAESESVRAVQFIPLTLLPDDNVLAVVVAAGSGAPAVAIELDELDQTFASDATWRVSIEPGQGFEKKAFDDSAWSTARDLGPLGALVTCDAATGFPSGSPAHWIGPPMGMGDVAAFRKVIRIAPEGFGAGTTGGSGAAPTLVDTWDELQALATDPTSPRVLLLAEGDHDFRDKPRAQTVCPKICSQNTTMPFYAAVAATDACEQPIIDQPRYERVLALGSNKTLVGLGRGASLRGVTIEAGASHNFIVRNLVLYDVNPGIMEAGDAFSLTRPNQAWIDHCTTKWISDGFADLRSGAQNITLSWMHFDGYTPNACDGYHSLASQATDASVTYHHCFFDHVKSHAPKVDGSQARVHLYDNLISDDPGYGVAATCGAQILMEANTLKRVTTPTERAPCQDETLLGMILAPPGSNSYEDVSSHGGGDGTEPHDTAVFVPRYPYELDVPQENWQTVMLRAGAGGPWAMPLTY